MDIYKKTYNGKEVRGYRLGGEDYFCLLDTESILGCTPYYIRSRLSLAEQFKVIANGTTGRGVLFTKKHFLIRVLKQCYSEASIDGRYGDYRREIEPFIHWLDRQTFSPVDRDEVSAPTSPQPDITPPEMQLVKSDGLIPIYATTMANEEVNAVDARVLWEQLGSKRQFANWIEARIEQCQFEAGRDFVVFNNSVKNSSGGRPAKEYWLTLDAAKEISMLEKNEIGKAIRKYFIQAEKELRRITSAPPLTIGGSTTEILLQQTALLQNALQNQLKIEGDVQAHEKEIRAHNARLKDIAYRLEDIEDDRIEAYRRLAASDAAPVLVAPKTWRMKCNDYIRNYAKATGVHFDRAYYKAYREFGTRYRKNLSSRLGTLKKRVRNANMLDVVDDLGMMKELYAVIVDLFDMEVAA